MFSRTTVPSLLGVMPTSLFWMAFSIAPRTPRSQGWIDDRGRLGHADAGQLVQRRQGAVIVHLDTLDEGGRGAPGADMVEVAVHRLDGGGHARLDWLVLSVSHTFVPPWISVPTGWPSAARLMLPSSLMSNTRMGISLSMHKLTAVESSTARRFESTSV